MTDCVYCRKRKGKRVCPALEGLLCPQCCGTHRLREIDCPSGCAYLPRVGEATHDAYGSVAARLRRFGEEVPGWAEQARRALLGADLPVSPWEEGLVGGWIMVGYTDANGECLIDRFLREHARETSPDEASALRCLREESWYSMFEIQEVRLHEGLRLVDLLFDDQSLFVRERMGTLQMDIGDVLLGWVVNLAGHYELTGACALVPPPHHGALLGLLRTELAASRIRHPALPDHLRIRGAIPAAHQMLRVRTEAWIELSGAEEERLRESERSWVGAVSEAPPSPDAGPQAEGPKPGGDSLPPERASGASHRLPPLPHEVMAGLIPGLRELVPSVARRMRASPSWGPTSVWSSEELAVDAEATKFIEGYAAACHLLKGWSRAASLNEANMLGHHVFYMANFEAHYRKTFWVDESLAWMLRQTELDVQGEFLNPPFPACAVVFTDAPTLRLVASALAADAHYGRRGPLRVAAVYLTRIPAPGEATGLDVSLLTDCGGEGRWPYLLARQLIIHPQDRLDTILESTFPDVRDRDPVFASRELKEVLYLVVNAILYATTAHLDAQVLGPPGGGSSPGRSHRRTTAPPSRAYSADDVFYLPGKIPISRVRQLGALGGHADGDRIFKRFMVRGHWRRPATTWKDPRLRWIEPYWKGPDAALILEREYRMKP